MIPSAARTLACVLAAAGVLGAGCGDVPAKPSGRSSVVTTRTDARSDDVGTPTPRTPPIAVTSPLEFAVVVDAMVLAGSASVPEGQLRWELRGTDGSPLAEGSTTARCGAPCRGPFRTRVPLRSVPLGSWELRVWSPDSDEDGGRRHEVMVPITVAAQRVRGAPPPDAPPPGMPPQG